MAVRFEVETESNTKVNKDRNEVDWFIIHGNAVCFVNSTRFSEFDNFRFAFVRSQVIVSTVFHKVIEGCLERWYVWSNNGKVVGEE